MAAIDRPVPFGYWLEWTPLCQWDYSSLKHNDPEVGKRWQRRRSDEMSRVLVASDAASAAFQLMTRSDVHAHTCTPSAQTHVAQSAVAPPCPEWSPAERRWSTLISFIPVCARGTTKKTKKKKKNHQGVNNLFEYSKHTSFHWTQLIVPWYSPWQPLPPRLSSVDHLNWPQFTMQRGERGRGSRRPGMIGKRRVQRGGGVRRSDEGEQAFAASACSLWLSKRRPSFIYSDIEFNCVSRGGLRFWTDLWTEVKACGKHGGATTSMWRAQRGGGLWNVMFFFFINRLCHWRQGVAFNRWPSGCELCHFQGVTVWRHMYVGQRSALILSKKG